MQNTRTLTLIAGSALALTLLAGCGGKSAGQAPAMASGTAPAGAAPTASAPAATPGKAAVELNNMKFNPATLEVTAGTAVTFTNKDNASDHSVYEGDPKKPEDAKFHSQDLKEGQSFTHTFDKPGTYQIYCKTDSHFLQGMTAKVVVK
ncbi:MAG TPA: plastocyanin/azurin family copper-binding protein [Symbiobacteriaceae bacterium]|jgi:plastocyanin